MNLTIDMDTSELRKAFNAAPSKVTFQLNKWIYKTGVMTEREVKINIPPNVDTGQLQSSVHTRIGHLQAEVKPTVKHAIFVHEGRRPGGKLPPFQEGSSLNSWARRRGIPPFLAARSIARKGTKPNKFMDKAYRNVKPRAEHNAKALLNDIVRSI